MEKIIVKNKDDSIVSVESIVANLPYVETLSCVFNPDKMDHSPNILTKLLQIPHFKNIKWLHLGDVSGNFDFDAFYRFTEEKYTIKTFLEYRENISDNLKDKIESVIDKYLELGLCRIFKPPNIEFPGQNELQKEAFTKLLKKFG
uniref:Uncharacterized protein n=1 Tax=Panagrolaimus sp. ES5 TaxID=591445 RepID=A0AC34FZ15_9BILA